jgi:hypothetical protein
LKCVQPPRVSTLPIRHPSPTARAIRNNPHPNDDGSDGSRDTLTGRCETFDCDGCGHDGHRAKVQEKGDRPLFPGFVQPAEPAERLFEAQKGDRSIFRLSA